MRGGGRRWKGDGRSDDVIRLLIGSRRNGRPSLIIVVVVVMVVVLVSGCEQWLKRRGDCNNWRGYYRPGVHFWKRRCEVACVVVTHYCACLHVVQATDGNCRRMKCGSCFVPPFHSPPNKNGFS